MSTQFYKLKTAKVEKDTENALNIVLEVPAELKNEFKFIQGQYLTFRVFVDGKEERRSYSIINAPSENSNSLEVLVKILEDGKVSTVFKKDLKAGDELEVMKPTGNFHTNYHPSNKRTYVGLAAGSGISPILSNLKEALYQEPNSNAYLFYGNKSLAHILKKSEIERMEKEFGTRFRVINLVSREKSNNPVFEGRITSEKLEQLFEIFNEIPISESTYFICGPTEMIQGIADYLENTKKVPAIQVLYEYYTPPDEPNSENMSDEFKAIPNVDSMVTVILDDDEFTFHLNSKKQAILLQAEDEGLPVPYSCKGGVCCTCKAQVLEGEVFMEKNYALTDEEVEQGYILTCQSHPTTSNVMITYDV